MNKRSPLILPNNDPLRVDHTKPRSLTRRDALKMLVGAGTFLALPAHLVYAETAEELEAKAEETQQELDAAEAEYNQVKAQLEALAAEVQQLSIEQANTMVQIDEVNAEIRDIEAQIEATQAEIEKREQELAEKQDILAKRVAGAYKSGGLDFLDLLLTATSFEELTSNIYYLDKISQNDARLIADVKAIRAELEEQKAQLEKDKEALVARRAELEELNAIQEQQLANMRAKQEEVSALLNGLDAKVQALIEQHDAEVLAAEQEAERARQAAAAAAASGTSYSRVDVTDLTQGATGSQQAVINAAYSVPSPGAGLCAWWVEDVFEVAGIGSFGGNACDLYYYWCYSSDKSQIQPGMIIAVSTYPSYGLGAIYGHVGIYVGGGIVRENVGYINERSLDAWISAFSGSVPVRWGWMGGIALA